MQITSPDSLAVIGAGPVGLETAAAALEAGLDVHVFERGEPGEHPRAWGHVRMFTPWRANVGPASARLLARHGWTAPEPDARPTGAELADRCLAPLAAAPELAARVHAHTQVVHVSRRGLLPLEAVGDRGRAGHPFRLLVRDAGGRENFLHAHAVVDASGTYGSPNWAGTGGIPARGETHLAPRMCYRCDDVAGLRRERHAGRRTLVIGGGTSAATTVAALAALAAEAPGTQAVWVTRETAGALPAPRPDDPLPSRRTLFAEAAALRAGGNPAVAWHGGLEVEGFEFNSATHRYRVAFSEREGGGARVEEVDEVVVNTGFGPDDSLHRALQVHAHWASRAPMPLAEALLAAGAAGAAEPGVEALRHPETGFWIVGAKSYGRNAGFLLPTGYAQAAAVVAEIARARAASARA